MAEGLLCYTRLDDPRDVILNAQGHPLCPDDEVRIIDAAGQPVACGEVRKLQVLRPRTIRRHYRAPEQNARTLTADG
ncbi:MAG: hypothetical protein ACK4KV_17675 [Rhodocyclaceae bacterium]